MKDRSASLAAHHVRQFLETNCLSAATDAELLERFLSQHEEPAFGELVQRHGPIVLGLCRRVLRNQHDAEDAFQATFLVLARKGGSIRRPRSLAGWLLHVARRVALRARANADRRRRREAQLARPEPRSLPEPPDAEVCAILADELSRLPEKYRAAVVLCYLEGKTHAEAAHYLGVTAGAITGHLRRARDLLRRRLLRRGLDLASATVVCLLARDVAAVPVALGAATTRASLCFAAGGTAAGLASTHATTLARGALTTMMTKGMVLGAVALALAMLAMGAGLFSRQVLPDKSAANAAGTVVAVRTDQSGDPLPSGALARLGTVRWRHGGQVFFAAYMQNDRELLTVGADGFVRVWESATGKEVRRYGTGEVAALSRAAISADRKLLATSSKDGTITLWDVGRARRLATWKCGPPPEPAALGAGPEGRIPGPPRKAIVRQSSVDELLFSPDGRSLVVRDGCTALRLYDVTTGKEVRKFVPGRPGGNVAIVEHWVRSKSVAFTPDGKVLLFGTPAHVGGARTNLIWRFDVASGKELEVLRGPPGLRDSPLALAPDGKTWAWDDFGGPLRFWDMETGQVKHNLARQPSLTDLVFSSDSKQLLAASSWGPGVRTWDVASGNEVRRFGPFGAVRGRLAVSNLAISADGKTLAVGNDRNTVQQWDLSTAKELTAGPGHQGPITTVALSGDGKTVATRGMDDMVRFWDSATGTALGSIPLPADALRDIYWITFLSEDRVIVLGTGPNDSIHSIFDIKSGKQVGDWQLGVGVTNLAVSPDGRMVASRWRDGAIRVHDTLTGKVTRQMQGDGRPAGLLCDIDRHPERMAFSPDGKTLAVAALGQLYCGHSRAEGMRLVQIYEPLGKPIELWDVCTGRQLRQIDTGKHVVSRLVFSPDGRTLATINRGNTITLWEIATGKERFSFPSSGEHTVLAFTVDGRALLAAGEASPIIHAYSARTGKHLTQLKGHGGPITALAVKERALVSASTDTTALVWDLAEIAREQPAVGELDEAATEALWHDLGSADARKAHEAICRLSTAPRQAVPLLRERVKPRRPPDARALERLIADLDNDEYTAREQANNELAKMGDLAAVALQKALKDKPTVEMRRRIERLLEGLALAPEPPADLLRALRALEVLEQTNTPQARQAVEGIARGAAGTLLTTKARETLNRMR
jgi:RNA polymerase sigma factor (sigma-70 family)